MSGSQSLPANRRRRRAWTDGKKQKALVNERLISAQSALSHLVRAGEEARVGT